MSARSTCSAIITTLILLFSIVSSAPATAQASWTGAAPLSIDQAFKLSAKRDGEGALLIKWTIAKGYYLYRDKFNFRMGATDLEAPRLQGNAEVKDDANFGVTTVFHDNVTAVVRVSGVAGALDIHFQGCQDAGICYPPMVRSLDLATMAIADPKKAPVTQTSNDWTQPPPVPAGTPAITIADDGGGMIASLLKGGGVLMVLGSFMLFGILLAFTPCVFPMYPILAGAIAGQGETATPGRGFMLSLAYVVAMATAFGFLGVAAAWSGQNLQMALQSPAAVGMVSILFVILALSMFGLFELQLPSKWVNTISRVGHGKRGSLASAGLLGFISALIVGPCVTAPLAGALVYIAQTGDVALGAASLFALGLGKGIPLIVFGTLGPKALPKAAGWMVTIRQAFGFVFVATAIWMVSRLLPAEMGLALWALFAIGLAVWLGAFDTLTPDVSGGRRSAKAAGLAAALYGIILAVGAASGASDPLRPLGNLVAQRGNAATAAETLAFQTVGNPGELAAGVAAGNGKPSLLYVTADWCVSCTIIDRNVLQDAAIQTDLARFNLIKLNVSANTPDQQQMMQSLRVVGPPTMIFVDSEGQEAAGTRLVGDVTTTSVQTSAAKIGGAQ